MREIHERCLINGTKDLKVLKGYENYPLVKSNSSGLVFMQKVPSIEELSKYYNNYSRSSPVSEITLGRYRALLNEFERFRKTNKILDVGCGGGHFLAEAKKKGWEVYGTEFTKEAADIPAEKGINMTVGPLDTSTLQIRDFDVITSFEVIEHINTPLPEVRNIHTLLRIGGLFYFTTPNFNALERKYLGSKYPVINYPGHLIYFTPKTITRLLKKVGFSKKKILTTGIYLSSFKKKPKENMHKKHGGIILSDFDLRESIEKNKLLRLMKGTVNFILNLTGLGNSLKGYFIKN